MQFLKFALPLLALLALGQDLPPLPRDSLPEQLPASFPLGLDGQFPPGSDAEVALGRKLFFDPLLSLDRRVACASCHEPERGFAGSGPTSLGVAGQRTLRNAPTLFNRGIGIRHMWDGRARTLAEQVLLPIADPREMGLEIPVALARLSDSAEYRAQFEAVYAAAPDAQSLSHALSAFVGRLFLGDSPVDRFRAENDFAALSSPERSGLWFYESRGQCWRCHSGPNFSDDDFHNTGVGAKDGLPEPGRAAISAAEVDRGKFKTPTLRGLALTAPYMHDGSLATLEDVVQFYRTGGQANSHLAPELAPIEMDDADAANLVAFLRALSRRAPAR
jgi:cytochrome c peroxidase